MVLIVSSCIYLPVKGYMRELKFLKANRTNVDTSYVKPYVRDITGRIFFSQKYTSVKIPGSASFPSFRYRPNTRLTLGIGATYRSVSLNFAYGIPLLNNDNDIKGKTRYIDLQGHFYPRKFAIDFFGQFYKGYYLSPENFVPGYPGYYIQPNLSVRMVGISAYYVFNNSKFSYRSSMIQNERQMRSAGTFLLGGEFFYGTVRSDSVLVPVPIADQYPQSEVNRMRFAKIGPGVGYAYTFVYKEHWFATGSITINPSIDLIRESTLDKTTRDNFSISLNYMTRLAVGYNSRRWIYTASWIENTIVMKGSYNAANYKISTGVYRVTIARRFGINRKTKKLLNPADDIIDAPKKIIQ